MIPDTLRKERAIETRAPCERRRFVFLGASNLTLALPLVVAELRRQGSLPLDLFSAHGHGRSYGLTSSVLGRTLPSILDCGLWHALGEPAPGGIDALLTDIGNDIMYGAEVPTIAAWIEECLVRLLAHRARVAIARLPLSSIEGLPRWRFEILRTLLFPTHRIAFDVVLQRVRDLDARLVELARAHAAVLIQPHPDWYAFDPIHIRRSARVEAWNRLLSSGTPGPRSAGHDRLGFGDRRALARARQEARRWFGRAQSSPQPSAILSDGSTVALY
jgi:hypothetical protein